VSESIVAPGVGAIFMYAFLLLVFRKLAAMFEILAPYPAPFHDRHWHLLSILWCLCHYCCHSYMLCICNAQLLLHSLGSCNGHESLDPIILGVLHLVIMHACVWCMLKIFCALWAALHCAFTVCASCQRLWLLCYDGLISHLAIWACYTTRHNVLTSSDFTSNIFTTLLVSLLVVTSK